MKDTVSLSDKYSKRAGSIFISGIQALVRLPLIQKERDLLRGLNTAGFISGYQGSPLAGYDLELARANHYLEKASIFHNPGLNEEIAATSVWGSQQSEFLDRGIYEGVFGIWYGKGPGVDRAMDAFKHANAAGSSEYGGVLAIAGDDHGAKSSTLPHQSDHNFISAFIPYLYPSSIDDIIRFGLIGIEMSRYSGCWSGMKIVSDVADSSKVYLVSQEDINLIYPSEEYLGEYSERNRNILYKDNPRDQDHRLQRIKGFAAQTFGRVNHVDSIIWKAPNTKIGLITSGKSYCDVRESLRWLGIDEEKAAELGVGLYKVGMPWPLEPEGIRDFCEGLDHILVVEEKRELIEHQIKWQLYNWKEQVRPVVVGKQDESGNWLLPPENDLSLQTIVEVVATRIHQVTQSSELLERLDWFKRRHQAQDSINAPIERKPYFCSGCPHNSSTVLPEGSRALGGIGCHYMAVDMDRGTELFTQMGGEGTPWIGQASFSKDNHIFANLGDGTYKHSGILAIRAAIDSNINITYKILYNDAVAMTGGQEIGKNSDVAAITKQLLAEGVKRIYILSENPKQYLNLISPKVTSVHKDKIIQVQTKLKKLLGVSAIVFDQTCAAEKRRRRKRGTMEDPLKRIFINQEVCEGCGDCSIQSNCVSIEPVETKNGRKRKINQSNCNKDYSCLKGFCPSFISAEVVPKQKQLPQNFIEPPLPTISKSDEFNMMLTGIGGTGVLTVSAIIGMAAHLDDKISTTLDLTGLAQKGGAVWSHIKILHNKKKAYSHKISPANTDLLLACDPVVAAKEEIQETFSKTKTHAIVNTSLSPVSDFVKNRDKKFMESETLDLIKDTCLKLQAILPATAIAENLTGDAIGSNLVMLGAAFQAGLLPLSKESIEKAITLNKVGVEKNIYSFNLGRSYLYDPNQQIFSCKHPQFPEVSFDGILSDRIKTLSEYNKKDKPEFKNLISNAKNSLKDEVDIEGSLINLTNELFRIFAIKDEYRVAELHLRHSKKLINEFGEKYSKLCFYLSPPLLSFIKDKKTLRPRKYRVPGYIAIPIFLLLRKLKFLRGTFFDIFRFTNDRKRDLHHKSLFIKNLKIILAKPPGTKRRLIDKLIQASSEVRGYGEVREQAFTEFCKKYSL